MTSPSQDRNIYGTTALTGYCQEFYLAGDPQAEAEYHHHNRDFYAQVRELGLL
jgi:hypothetical protein